MTGQRDSVSEFVDDDPRAAALLRDSLSRLRDQLSGDPAFAEVHRDLQAVLEGRMDLRELAAVPAFRDIAEAGMRDVQAHWQALDPEQRAAQVAAGRAMAADPGDPES